MVKLIYLIAIINICIICVSTDSSSSSNEHTSSSSQQAGSKDNNNKDSSSSSNEHTSSSSQQAGSKDNNNKVSSSSSNDSTRSSSQQTEHSGSKDNNNEDSSSSSNEHTSSSSQQASSKDNNNEGQYPVCGENEIYSTCSNGGCRRFKCSAPTLCVDLVEGGCKGGCICKDEYTRDDNGNCIPEALCPLICNNVNEVAGCEILCPPQTCDSVDRKTKCGPQSQICKPACICKNDYYRNKNSECVSKSDCKYENAVKQLSKGNVDFTESFLCAASSLNPGASVIYSPFSLSFLLAQLDLYASGISLDQLTSVINLSKSSIRSTIPQYLTDLNAQTNVNFSLAEKVYVNYKYKLTKKFLADTKNIFSSKAQTLDFSKSTEAAKIINNWVKNKTNNLITDLVSPDSLTTNTVIVLADAIYFKSSWQTPFKERNTRDADFFVSENKNVTVKMMNQVGYFDYADMPKLNIQAAQLKYKNANFSYLVLLPKSKTGLGDLLDKIRDTSNSVLQDVLGNLTTRSINLSLPSIKTTTSTDIKQVFEKLNITALFDPNTAGLTGIIEGDYKLGVSSAVQKAAIIVNESGSEAAAGNAIVVGTPAASLATPPIVFKADHPYIYFILYDSTPLFCGIFAG